MKKILCISIVALLCLFLAVSCGKSVGEERKGKVYLDLFDTVTTIYSYAGDSDALFNERCAAAYSVMLRLHMLGDIYNEYEGMNNVCTINGKAGSGEWVETDPMLVDFLIFAKEIHSLTGGKVSVMMGSVLYLWHEAREAEPHFLPEEPLLLAAADHMDIDSLEIDRERSAVRIIDGDASLDTGALMKGYAVEKAAEELMRLGASGYVINAGGNIRAVGTKRDGGSWSAGVRNPSDPDGAFILRLGLSDTACVTSGTYERYFILEGKEYHHIIDPETLYPASRYSSVTVVTHSSAMADALSTALFLMDEEEIGSILESVEGAAAFLVREDGTVVRAGEYRGLEL